MDESYQNVSQQSNFMDLTISPEVSGQITNEPVKIDRPPRNFGQIDNLRSIQELPTKYRCIFEYPFFNIIQSNVLDDVLYSDVSVVISAPTGSGKTVVFELAIIRLLMKFEETNFSDEYKIVYVAPVKALCHERLSEWHTKFSKIGLSCIVLTGDSDNIDIRCIRNNNIIITTPEKWDSLTRNARETNFLETVKLFMIDEVHLLNEDSRGPNLEVVVSRMKILVKSENIRFLAVSATIPNIEDIAQWLGSDDQPAVYFKIGEELRPVKLNKIVLGYPCPSETAAFKFDLTLNYKLQNVLMNHAEGKPTLIFCSTRKGVELTASHLSQNLTFHLSPSQLSLLSSASSSMYSSLHKSFTSNGIGCHHAGMSLENRSTVEALFREGHLPVLVATSTLAMGVNLPAHLVVVKGTKTYVGGIFQEYSESSILQMIGRAGRPQFDTSATVVIMTSLQEKGRYEKMLGGTELIESNLHRHLTQHLNAEVVLGTITDIAIALEWLRYTFLYIRVLKNPKHYNIPTNYTKNQIEKKLQDWCQIEINALNKYGMLQIDQTDGFSVSPTNMGHLMANYYLAFSTMKLFTEIKGNECLSEMLMIVSKCTEFSETYLRVNDKKTLNTLNKCKYQETIRFPLKTTVKTTAMKIFCLIQATLGCIRIQNPTLAQESIKIMRIGERIIKCIVNYLLHKTKSFSALLNALILYQCFTAKIWENSPYVSRQFPKIGNVLSSMLVSAGKTSFKTILETSPRDIERIINRAPPMGNDIVEAVMHLPFYQIHLEPSEHDKFKIKIIITLLNSDDINKNCTTGFNSHMTLLIGDTDNNILLCKKIFHHTMATCKESVQYIDVIIKTDHVIQVYLISENWVGIDCKENYDIIINQDKISTKSSTTFNNNNSDSSNNQKSITSYFQVAKNDAQTKQPKKTKPKNTRTKTIDSYFTKQNNNGKKTTNNSTQLFANSADLVNDSNSSNNNQNYGLSPKNTNNYAEKHHENVEENIATYRPENNYENIGQEVFDKINDNNCLNPSYSNHNFPVFNYDKDPFTQVFQKNVPEFKEDQKLLLTNNLTPRNNLSQQTNFANFSQNLFRKFPEHSQNIDNNSTNFSSYSLQSIYQSNSDKLNSNTQSIVKRLENNLKLKSTLNQFKYTPQQKLTHNATRTLVKTSLNTPQKRTGPFSQNKETKYSSSQISLSSENYIKSPQPINTVTNEELEKFKHFIEVNNMNNKLMNTNIPCTITSTNNSTQNDELNSEFYPMQFCDVTYNKSCEEDILISSGSSHNSQNDEEIIVLSDTEDNKQIEKPYFPKSFREYVQNSIDNLKKSTLVNEYFNYDIGFQEFLMGPLDTNSDEESSNEDKEILNSRQDDFLELESVNNNTFVSPEFPFEENEENIENIENITFLGTAELINKNEPPFEHNFKTNQSFSFSPEMDYQNLTFHSPDIYSNENNFQVFENSENSERSVESQTETNLKLENRMKIIEQYYNSPPKIQPIKRQKLSVPLFPITTNKKYFKDPIKTNDTFKKMAPFKNILSKYGNENKVSLPKNTEKELGNDPVINEIVKRTAYSYSIQQENESVEMSVMIYEKEQKPINSFETRKSKLKNDDRNENNLSLFKPYFRG